MPLSQHSASCCRPHPLESFCNPPRLHPIPSLPLSSRGRFHLNRMHLIESRTRVHLLLTSCFILDRMSQVVKTVAVEGTFTDLR